jgi:hypothetical protein
MGLGTQIISCPRDIHFVEHQRWSGIFSNKS